MDSRSVIVELLAQAGRLLLEYSDSTSGIQRALTTTARALTDEPCIVAVSYDGVAVSLGANGPRLMPVRELRFNMAIQAGVHSVLDQVRTGALDATTALSRLERIEAEAPRHSRWLVVLMLGAAAASLAALLGADAGAVICSGASTSLGLAARQELGRRHLSVLTLPFVAALIGAVVGSAAIVWGWTRTPGLALIVPALILVPGPHFLNGLLDLFDNYVPMSIARLTLSTGIVTAAALGTIVGVEAILGEFPQAAINDGSERLTLLSDMVLAGVVAAGFAAAYNTVGAHLALASAGGMVGHGLRFLALNAGWTLGAATFAGGLGVGLVAMAIARFTRTPVAAIAYAGAVTMMPGVAIYRALGGVMQFARLQIADDSAAISGPLSYAAQAGVAVGALALGLVLGTRAVQLIIGDR